jgi:hypothetical protein
VGDIKGAVELVQVAADGGLDLVAAGARTGQR